MQSVLKDKQFDANGIHHKAPVVIVGSGPVGVQALKELHKHAPMQSIVIYGDEPYLPYNRVRLSGLLSGQYSLSEIETDLNCIDDAHVIQRQHTRIVDINTSDSTVVDDKGQKQPYSSLILATGSRPHIPNIDGIKLPGVFRFRDMADVQALMARQASSRKVVVLGGGLLGLEAAHAMQRHHSEVVVIDHMDRLMPQQLDKAGAELLREHILGLGIQVVLSDPVAEITGEHRIEGIQLRSGRVITCDTLILSVGIRSNIELALDAGIAVGRGIKVDHNMRTNVRNIYAVGECAEHDGRVYGLVAPGIEQAAVAAHNILGKRARYLGSLESTRLKVVGKTVYSAGEVGEELPDIDYNNLVFQHPEKGIYRRLVLRKGRLYGAICFGDWSSLNRVQENIQNRRRLWPWQRKRFELTGELWEDKFGESVLDWPSSATVCNCTGVTKAKIESAISAGANTLQLVQDTTGASSVCGSCRSQVSELLADDSPAVESYSRPVLFTSILVFLLALSFFLSPTIPFQESVQTEWKYDSLWRDGTLKQITGFTLLGLSLLVGLVSMRKRWKRFNIGEYAGWRYVHILSGVLMWVGLIAHTGMRMGEQLNLILMLSFIAIMLMGSVAGVITGTRHRLRAGSSRRVSDVGYWLHVALVWPLPALLSFHILSVYYF